MVNLGKWQIWQEFRKVFPQIHKSGKGALWQVMILLKMANLVKKCQNVQMIWQIKRFWQKWWIWQKISQSLLNIQMSSQRGPMMQFFATFWLLLAGSLVHFYQIRQNCLSKGPLLPSNLNIHQTHDKFSPDSPFLSDSPFPSTSPLYCDCALVK